MKKTTAQLKKLVAQEIIKSIEFIDPIFLGSGSTVAAIMEKLPPGTRYVSSSKLTSSIGFKIGLDEISLDSVKDNEKRICIDGADQVLLPGRIIIKGHGGALFREKITWSAVNEILVAVDENKISKVLTKSIPVVISNFAPNLIVDKIEKLDQINKVEVFTIGQLPFTTDDGMQILHLDASDNVDLINLDKLLRTIPGVIETGIFLPDDYEKIRIICATQDGIVEY